MAADLDPTSLPVTEENSDLIKRYIFDRLGNFPRTEIQADLENLDKFYHLQQRKDGKDQDFNSRYSELDIGIVNPNAETDTAFYVDTFLTSVPVFSAVSKKDKVAEATAIEAKIEKDAQEFSWVSNLTKAMRNVAKHNKCLAEVSWEKSVVTKKYGGLGTDGQKTIQDVSYQGNKVKSLSLYNCFWDTSVELSELSASGEFAGYVDLLTYIRLAELESAEGITIPDEVWQSSESSGSWENGKYVTPDVWANKETVDKQMNWLAFAGYAVEDGDDRVPKKYKNVKSLYTVHKFYIKTIPSLLSITVPSSPNLPQIFKIITVNGRVVKIQHNTDFHSRLPIIGGMALEDDTGIFTQGPAQLSRTYQETGKQLLDRQFAILDRLIGDRGLYDPQLIDANSLNSDVPDAKIPARPSAKDGLSGAYKPMPFNPNGFFEFGELLNSVKQMSEDAVGINKAQHGQFVKGNKTLGEWDDVMSGANAKPYLRAMVLESTFFEQLKFLVKSNIFQHQDEEEIYSSKTQQVAKFNPAEVRENILEITLTDGLKSAAKVLKSGGLEYMLQLALQAPQLAMNYDIAGLFGHLMQQGKGVDISQYALTPEQQNAALAAQNAGQVTNNSQQP